MSDKQPNEMEQIELDLLPDKPPEPKKVEGMNVDILLERLTNYVPREPDAKFLRSVRQWGIRVPIELNKMSTGELRLMAGRKRLRAAEILELEYIPAHIYEIDSLSESVITIDSNTQRSDNPLSDMDAILNLMIEAERKGRKIGEKEIVRLTGLPAGTVRKRMKLIDVPSEIIQGVRSGKVAVGTAERIANLPDEEKSDLVMKLERNGKLIGHDVDEIRRTGRTTFGSQIPAAVFETPDIDPEAHEHMYKIQDSWKDESGAHDIDIIVIAICDCGATLDRADIETLINRRF